MKGNWVLVIPETMGPSERRQHEAAKRGHEEFSPVGDFHGIKIQEYKEKFG